MINLIRNCHVKNVHVHGQNGKEQFATISGERLPAIEWFRNKSYKVRVLSEEAMQAHMQDFSTSMQKTRTYEPQTKSSSRRENRGARGGGSASVGESRDLHQSVQEAKVERGSPRRTAKTVDDDDDDLENFKPGPAPSGQPAKADNQEYAESFVLHALAMRMTTDSDVIGYT